jgi:hypothetical protein
MSDGGPAHKKQRVQAGTALAATSLASSSSNSSTTQASSVIRDELLDLRLIKQGAEGVR